MYMRPSARRSAASTAPSPGPAPTTSPRHVWSGAARRAARARPGGGSTTSSSATPTAPARTTATSPGWRCCWPGCRPRCPASTVNRLCGSSLEAAIERLAGDRDRRRRRRPGRRRRVDEPRPVGAAEARPGVPGGPRDPVLDDARLAAWSTRRCPAEWTISLGRKRREAGRDLRHLPRGRRTSSRCAATASRPAPGTRAAMPEVVPVPGVELERDEGIRADTTPRSSPG